MVASKVNFTNSARDLEAFIAPSRILKELEGEEDWAYRYVEPREGENARMRAAEKDGDSSEAGQERARLLAEREALYEEYERRTAEWIAEPDAERRRAVARDRDDIARRLHAQYWALDPYIRARSLYDRIGVIKPGGDVDYYPSAEAQAQAAAEAAKAPAANGSAAAPAPVAAPAATAPPVDTSADDLD